MTAAIGNAGTALVGTRAGAQVWRKGGMSVEATNSHSTYFALEPRRDPRGGAAGPRGLPARRAIVQVNLA